MIAKFGISDAVEIIDYCLYLREYKALVIGDAHLGYEESLTKQGVLVPKFQFREIMERMERILSEVEPEIIIVVGDLKHEFDTISREEWRQAVKFIDLLKKSGDLVLIKGNHDTILEPIADKKNVEVVDHYVIGEYYLCHGHKVPKDMEFQNSDYIIMGHEHPALGLQDGPRYELFKCFLKGPYKDKEVIVLPSLSSLPEGSDVLKERLMSPMLKDIKKFRAYVVEDKVYDFGVIGEMK